MLFKMTCVIFKTRFSNILIEETDGKIIKIQFTKQKVKPTTNLILLKAKTQIIEYLDKRRISFSFTINPNGTKFQKSVWDEISLIKYGQTISYSSLAKKIKSSPRPVGNACGANPCLLIIPCHRVIAKSGKIGGFSSFGGIVHKDLLLSLEKN